MQSAKETAANIGASARSGMEKTKAVVQEKVEKVGAKDPIEKDMATQKKEERVIQAEMNKRDAKEHNAATKQTASAPGTAGTTQGSYTHSTTGATGYSTGPHQMSAVPGHGIGQPAGGHVTEGAVGSHPLGTGTATTRGSVAQNPRAGSGTTGYGTTGAAGQGTGGTYS